MGYDDGECVQCYCEGDGNNHTSSRCDVCLSCLDGICGEGATYRVIGALQRCEWSTNGTCYLCLGSGISRSGITIAISLCHYHGGKDSIDSDSEFH